jgi:AcrR family transcriptional regulator
MSAEQRRESIIKATIKVVARLSYDRATTSLIAKEARINEALIYSHFKSKQKLQLAMLDYLLEYRLRIYTSNPIFQAKNQEGSIIKAVNDQYVEELHNPDIDMFSCILKALFAIDSEIREKGWSIVKAFQNFNRQNLEADIQRGFLKEHIDPDILAWEMLGKVTMISIMAVNGKMNDYDIQKVKKSMELFEEFFLRKKPKQ